MFTLLHQYLVNHSSVDLPGIGTLQYAKTPAYFDVTHRQIYPSTKMLSLSPSVEKANQQPLIGFLSKQMDMPEEESKIILHHFLAWAKDTIDTQKILKWDNVGEFKQGENGAVQFVQSNEIVQYLPPVMAIDNENHLHTDYPILVGNKETTGFVMEEELQPHVVKKSYWWVWAIAIGVMSAAIIALKFLG